MISEANKTTLIKRSKSFAWATGMMVLAAGVDFVLASLELFDLPQEVTVILGLVLAQISKQLNSK
jgi:hypothetical protein